MADGDLALVLHAHLPYVRSGEAGSLEEDWYFQALQECYLPLLEMLEAAAADPDQDPRLTMGVSPTLLSLLSDPELNHRFVPWLELRLQLLVDAPEELRAAARDLTVRLEAARDQFLACGGDLLPRLQSLQRQGVVDLITCGATHGYLPLLRDSPEVTDEALLALCRERVARFKVPRHVLRIRAEDIPATPSGRARKFLLTQIALERLGLTA